MLSASWSSTYFAARAAVSFRVASTDINGWLAIVAKRHVFNSLVSASWNQDHPRPSVLPFYATSASASPQ
jgi:hypothetical protein